MKTDTTDTTAPQAGMGLPPATVFSLLAADRRRFAVRYLASRVDAVPLGEVAEHVALAEGCPTW
jgi:hypothetical protein